MNKQLERNSQYAEFDINHDGVITDKEMKRAEKLIEIENEDKKADAQRKMAWFALFGMILYPLAVIISNLFGLNDASLVLGDMAPTYFVSVAAIVAAFYAKEGYVAKKISETTNDYPDANY